MAHIEFISYATPAEHKRFLDQVSKLRYRHEGKDFVGEVSPCISEVKWYDVRIPEEHVSAFVRDMGMITPDTPKGWTPGKKKRHANVTKWIFLILRFIRKFTPFKGVVKAPGPKQFQTNTGHYTFLIGKLDDPKVKCSMTGEPREWT